MLRNLYSLLSYYQNLDQFGSSEEVLQNPKPIYIFLLSNQKP